LLFEGLNAVRAVSPEGHTLWTRGADSWNGAWSSKGLVAISAYRGVAVYDEAGHLRFKFTLPTAPASISWSPDGSRLAVLWGVSHYSLGVRSETGARLLEKRVQGGSLGWDGDGKIVMGIPGCITCSKPVAIDVRTGQTSPASDGWLEPRSPDGKLAIVTPQSGSAFVLGVTRLASGATETYGKVGGCYGDGNWTPAVSAQQFAGRSVVYSSWAACDAPFDNLYSVGASIHRLTNVRAQESQPALSPDGSEIAYVWAAGRGMSCKGCADGIRLASANGTPIRTLTSPQDCTFDDSPTWSPDGKTILYSESTCEGSPGQLYSVPAGGGTPHKLGIAGDHPAWGPTRIAYEGTQGLVTANPDGSGVKLVAKRGSMPAWSRDGRLAYLVGGFYSPGLVAGSHRMKLPFSHVQSLAWTPDGTRLVIAASKTRLGSLDLYTLRPNGTGLRRLTKNFGVYPDSS
jgi:hypothetical protein